VTQAAPATSGFINESNLNDLPADVSVPLYDRSTLTSGIVHIGVGNFHRAHQALVIDRLLRLGEARDWSITGVGLLPSDETIIRSLQAQDGLYTLVEKSPEGHWDYTVIGSLREVFLLHDGVDNVLAHLTDPEVRIVSLTITEGGYNNDPVTGAFMLDTPAVAMDLGHGVQPQTVFGLVTEALARRRAAGFPPFTVMSCDNIQHNGDFAKSMFIAFAREKDSDLADWIDSAVAFPNSMVDRITPVTTQVDREVVSSHLGISDSCPVLCEPFFQWVVEDNFPTGRPPWELVGVQVTEDVAPYEKMKLRLLNASHQGLAYFAHLMGYEYVHDAAQDPLIATFLHRYMDEEATPTLDSLPGVDLEHYKSELIERFANPQVRDTVARLAAESSDRIPKWLLPVVRERLEHGGSVALSAAIVASWARYAEGIDEDGREIDVVDPLRDELIPIARMQDDDPTAFIENRALFGDLVDHQGFRDPYVETLSHLKSNGARATLAWILGHS